MTFEITGDLIIYIYICTYLGLIYIYIYRHTEARGPAWGRIGVGMEGDGKDGGQGMGKLIGRTRGRLRGRRSVSQDPKPKAEDRAGGSVLHREDLSSPRRLG